MNEETMKKYMDEADQRLQRLEDAMTNDPAKPKETDKKENDVLEFINLMKVINTTPEPEPDEGTTNTDEFVNLMRNINK
jgi:hypothetical protein